MLNIESLNFDQMQVLEILYSVFDPEIGVNIVDLGLIRALSVEGNHVDLDMTLTTAACPLSEELEEDIATSLADANLASSVKINWVMLPPWDISHVTPEGRQQLRAMGF